MANSSAEIATLLHNAAKHLQENAPRADALADHLSKLGALFDRLYLEATEGVNPIDDVTLSTVGRFYQDIAIKLCELAELVAELEEIAKDGRRPVAFAAAMNHAAMKVAKISELTHHATRVLNLRLS